MKVNNLITTKRWWNGEREFAADFQFDSRPDLNRKVWFKIKNYLAVTDEFPTDSFFCAAYPMALHLNEKLEFEGQVSAKLLRNISKVNKYLGYPERTINITTQGMREKRNEQEGTGLFFTLGIDSFHSVISLKNKVDKLIFVDGYDVYPEAREMMNRIKQGLEQVAKFCQCEPAIVTTNLRYDLSEKFVPWVIYHGVALASVGHLLKNISLMYISGSDQYRSGITWGTGLVLDRLWSSENIKFVPVAGRKSRVEKIREIVAAKQYWPLLSNYLRVCWQKMGLIPRLNCLECEKCLRTYILLRLGGFKGQLKSFEGIDLKNVGNLTLGPEKVFIWKEIAREIKNNAEVDKEVADCLAIIENMIR